MIGEMISICANYHVHDKKSNNLKTENYHVKNSECAIGLMAGSLEKAGAGRYGSGM